LHRRTRRLSLLVLWLLACLAAPPVLAQAGAARSTGSTTYSWKPLRFGNVPVVVFERFERFLAGVFTDEPDALGERLSTDTWWLGPDTGAALFVRHEKAGATRLMVFRLGEPLPTLLGTLSLPGSDFVVVDLDGDAVPEVVVPTSLQRLLAGAGFTMADYPTVDVVLWWNAVDLRYQVDNAHYPTFLGGRLHGAYQDLRAQDPATQRRGMVAIAFYFFSTDQPEEGRRLLERHVPDAAERERLGQAFASSVRLPWHGPCGCRTGWACDPGVKLCQPRDRAAKWQGWPHRLTLRFERARLAALGGGRGAWDDDGTLADPFVELAVDEGAPQASPVLKDTLQPAWGWSVDVLLYPASTIRLMLKDKDPAFDQLIAMKTWRAADFIEQAALARDHVLNLVLERVRELVIKVSEPKP
jgi:hypothetical protein